MAMRTKTVTYAWDTYTSALALTTRLDFASKTLTIAETAKRKFIGASIEVAFRDNSATAVSMTAWLIGIKLGAAAFDDATVTDTIANTGEHQGIFLNRSQDLEAYFNTNFGSGTTQTCQIGVLFTAMPSINISVKLHLTYIFDDASASTRTKTVPVVIDSSTAVLSNLPSGGVTLDRGGAANTGTFNAGISSSTTFAGDGYVEFRIGAAHIYVGLSTTDPNILTSSINFAIYGSGLIDVLESNVNKGTFGAHATTDLYKIERVGTTITYAKNGAVFYTSLASSTGALLIDVSIRDAGAARNIRLYSAGVEQTITWQNNTNVATPYFTALAAVGGTSGIPQLTGTGGLLPETSVSIKDIWFEVIGNEAAPGTSDWQLNVMVDSDGVLSGAYKQNLSSATLIRYIRSLPAMTTTASHTLSLYGTVTSMLCWQQVVMYVTYTYDHSTTTRTLNSRYMPFHMGMLSAVVAPTRWRQRFTVNEPGTITLKQSGILLFMEAASNQNLNLRCGAQSFRTYTHTAGGTTCGGYATSHRFDADAAAGTGGLTLVAGENTLDVDAYAGAASVIGACSGIAILLYESDVASDGVDAHAHTVMFPWRQTAAGSTAISDTSPEVIPSMTGPHYYLEHVGMIFNWMTAVGNLFVEIGALAHEGGGLRYVCGEQVLTDNEIGIHVFGADITRHYRRWATDTGPDKLDINMSRFLRGYIGINAFAAYHLWVTFSAFERYVADNVTGYSGSGDGITVEIFDVANDVKLITDITVPGGAYSGYVPTPRSCYAVARVDSTHTGRSDDVTPSSTVAVFRDGPTGVYLPKTDAQWTALGVAVPSHFTLLDDEAGQFRDRRGREHFTQNGSPTYRNQVTGWKSYFAGTEESGAANQGIYHTVGLGVDTTGSFAYLVYLAYTAPSATRALLSLAGTGVQLSSLTSGIPRVTFGGANTSGVNNHAGITTVRPYLFRINVTLSTVKVFTLLEEITPSWGTGTGSSGTHGIFGSTVPTARYNLMAMWEGAAAEALNKTLLTTLGWGSLPY